ncbi:putative nucleotidyltransferase substrate binding domain-containing protein [Nakamurella lactea]|uniref:putative nucleotidyltransferase substrate binding domain-containing protein n=1 Tax=Nakamurella lactea TaxID=459515 RepID=UPI00040B126C|nr:putative nucleotidyltransferase substrate binding domain-containing protein [Nakamurella lactea]
MSELGTFLGELPPFDSLTPAAREALVAAGRVSDFRPGQRILDGFVTGSDEVFVVLSGEVELWMSEAPAGTPADEVLGRGGIFGFTAVLSGTKTGPRVVAVGPVRVLRLPAELAAPAFSSPAGMRFVTRALSAVAGRTSTPTYSTVDELIVSPPLSGPASLTVAEAARRMTAAGLTYLAVPLPSGNFGIVTDRVLRERVVAAGLPPRTPIGDVMVPAVSAVTDSLAADALVQLTESDLDHLLVVDRAGALRGVILPQDFMVSVSSVGLLLREQLGRADSIDSVVQLGHRLPSLLHGLFERGRQASEVTAIYSTVVDQLQRAVLGLVLDDHPEVDTGQITWLSLGSNGRREPVLGSDIDSAVVLGPEVDTEAKAASYRAAFVDVEQTLRRAGLHVDEHGATPSKPAFARTQQQWRAAAQAWLRSPLTNQGMVMSSLLLDGRPIQGDPALPVVHKVFGDIRSHPGTFKLLLTESLSNRARLRSVRDVLVRRAGTFDIKAHALRPVVDIARWAALGVQSAEVSTRGRLMAASGSELLPTEQATVLMEVFEVLQRLRLGYQLDQHDRGERPSNVLSRSRLSPLDRSVLAQAVREIGAVQRRLANVIQFTDPDDWASR